MCLAYRGRDDCRREPVAIVAADLILLFTKIEVVVCQVFIAQSYLGIDFAKRTTILRKAADDFSLISVSVVFTGT